MSEDDERRRPTARRGVRRADAPEPQGASRRKRPSTRSSGAGEPRGEVQKKRPSAKASRKGDGATVARKGDGATAKQKSAEDGARTATEAPRIRELDDARAPRAPGASRPPATSSETAHAGVSATTRRLETSALMKSTPASTRSFDPEVLPTAAPTEAGRRRAPHVRGEGVVVVTGVVGRLGQLLVRVLHRDRSVVGIDRRDFPGRPKDVVHHLVDIRRKKTRDIFRSRQVDAVVHLGVMHNPRASDRERHTWNVVAFQKLLDHVAEFEVPKLVVLSSANVYGPQPENPQFLTEEAPLLGSQSFRSMRDLVEMDMLAQSFFWRHPQTETVILRPVHILGRVRNAPSNYLRLERPVTIMGFDPMVQVIHERDVVDAIVRALAPGVRGIFNLRGPGELPLSRVFRILRKSPMPIPAFAAKAAIDRLWNLRLTSFPSPEIDYIRYVCMVDDSRARDVLGFRPRHGVEETVRAVLAER